MRTPLRESGYSFEEVGKRVGGLGISPSAVSLLDSLKSSIETLGEKIRFNPDFLLEREGKHVLVEAKSWPVWSRKLDWKAAVKELGIRPHVFASYARHGNKGFRIDRFMYFWYSQSGDHNAIVSAFKEILGPLRLDFDVWYIEEILPKAKDREWYKQCVNEVRKQVSTFLDTVMEGRPLFEESPESRAV